MTVDKQFILFVISDNDMRNILLKAFQEHGCPFSYACVSTVREAVKVLSQNIVHAIVTTTSIALSGDDSGKGLIVSRSGLPPTITLIGQGDDFPYYLYPPYKNNDWVTMPFELQELYSQISGVRVERINKWLPSNSFSN